MGIAFAIVALVIVGGVVGSAINFGGIILGVPLALLFIGAVIGKETMDRQMRIMRMKRFRREARAQKVDFDPADRRTVV
jgi:hypothetical protein